MLSRIQRWLTGPEVADYGDCVGAGGDDSSAIASVDAADGHYWDSGNGPPNCSKSCETHRRICAVFGGGRKNWTNSQVIEGQTSCLLGLRQVVSGKADDYIVTKQAPCGLNGKIILPQVYTIGLNRKRDIDTVIYYYLKTVMTRD